MMPEIISQVKSQVSEEIEHSRLSTQPLIKEENTEPKKMEEPKINDKKKQYMKYGPSDEEG